MNSATLYGTLIQTPELRYTSDQKPVCTTYVQFTERTKEAAKATIKAVAFGKVADALHRLPQSATVILEGSVRMNKIQTAEGNRTVPEFTISRIETLAAAPAISSNRAQTVETTATAVNDESDDSDTYDNNHNLDDIPF